ASISNLSATSYTFNNVVAGSYEVRVTDGLGCTITEATVDIVDPPVLTASVETIFAPGICSPAFGFNFKEYPTTGFNGTLQFSHDNGISWRNSDTFDDVGLNSGDEVKPSIRTVDGSGNTLCRFDLPQYTLTYPLDDLDISIAAIVVGCDDLQVTVQGNQGTPDYIYTYSEDPVNFDPATAIWTSPAQGLGDPYVFTDLTPGRTYVFYVQDSNGCIRQSEQNVNEIPGVNLPLKITETVIPSCDGTDNGSISYTLNPNTSHPEMHWEFYEVGNPTPIQVSEVGGTPSNVDYTDNLIFSGLAEGEYYLIVTQVDVNGDDSCIGGSENTLVEQQLPITANVTATQEIGCNQPGLISITNINGGTASYTYGVTGPAGFTAITATSQNPIEIPANSPAGDYNVTIT
ncbi:MAG: hypothetical protein ABJM12_13695, partial [Ekhidna sp.]